MRALKVAALLVWMLMSAAASNVPNVPNRLTIVVFNHAGVPRTVLNSAMKEGRRPFRAAGVETEWILCDPVEGCNVPERFVKVKILSRPLHTTHVSPDVLGATTCIATEQCVASDVFYNQVLTFADDASAAPDITLAYVMVHEIGHLLGLGHRPGGIMTTGFTWHDLQRAALGRLGFGDDDAHELRAVVARSLRSAEATRQIKLPGWRGEFSE